MAFRCPVDLSLFDLVNLAKSSQPEIKNLMLDILQLRESQPQPLRVSGVWKICSSVTPKMNMDCH